MKFQNSDGKANFLIHKFINCSKVGLQRNVFIPEGNMGRYLLGKLKCKSWIRQSGTFNRKNLK
jgi:hypothetical protein